MARQQPGSPGPLLPAERMLAVTASNNARVGVPTAQVRILSLTEIPFRGREPSKQDTACKVLQAQIIDMDHGARIRRALIVIKVPHKTLVARALASACGRLATALTSSRGHVPGSRSRSQRVTIPRDRTNAACDIQAAPKDNIAQSMRAPNLQSGWT